MPSAKGSLLGPAGHQLDPVGHARLGDVALALAQHVEGEVDPDHPGRAPVGQLEGDPGRARGHVEHATGAVGDDVVDHGPPPAAVLTHRQELGQAVVALRAAA